MRFKIIVNVTPARYPSLVGEIVSRTAIYRTVKIRKVETQYREAEQNEANMNWENLLDSVNSSSNLVHRPRASRAAPVG